MAAANTGRVLITQMLLKSLEKSAHRAFDDTDAHLKILRKDGLTALDVRIHKDSLL